MSAYDQKFIDQATERGLSFLKENPKLSPVFLISSFGGVEVANPGNKAARELYNDMSQHVELAGWAFPKAVREISKKCDSLSRNVRTRKPLLGLPEKVTISPQI